MRANDDVHPGGERGYVVTFCRRRDSPHRNSDTRGPVQGVRPGSSEVSSLTRGHRRKTPRIVRELGALRRACPGEAEQEEGDGASRTLGTEFHSPGVKGRPGRF